MFSRSSKGSTISKVTPVEAKPATPSIISADVRIVGDVQSQGEVQVDGTIDGDIRTQTLLVGEGAQITGEIVADTVIIRGSVTGQVKARSVELAKTARLIGDILHEDLAIETGAFLEGHCKRVIQKKDQIKSIDKLKNLDPQAMQKVNTS
jgi:cytoskeletal protein CcmA (bactofilin family)